MPPGAPEAQAQELLAEITRLRGECLRTRAALDSRNRQVSVWMRRFHEANRVVEAARHARDEGWIVSPSINRALAEYDDKEPE